MEDWVNSGGGISPPKKATTNTEIEVVLEPKNPDVKKTKIEDRSGRLLPVIVNDDPKGPGHNVDPDSVTCVAIYDNLMSNILPKKSIMFKAKPLCFDHLEGSLFKTKYGNAALCPYGRAKVPVEIFELPASVLDASGDKAVNPVLNRLDVYYNMKSRDGHEFERVIRVTTDTNTPVWCYVMKRGFSGATYINTGWKEYLDGKTNDKK